MILKEHLILNINHNNAVSISPAAQPQTTRAELPRLLYSREEAAQILGISLRSVDYAIANEQLTPIRKGDRVLIHVDELERFARQNHPGRVQ